MFGQIGGCIYEGNMGMAINWVHIYSSSMFAECSSPIDYVKLLL